MKRVPSGGYTIIEVMIFLVVSAALLTSAMALISGKEERTRFSQAATMLEQNIKDTLNDVSTGFYPSNNRITCTTNGNGTISITSGTAEQGSQGCLFLGKAMRFERNSEKYEVYTMAASKNATGLGTGTTGANTQLLGGPSPGPPSGNNPGIVTTYDLSSDLKIVKAVSLENNLREVKGIAIVSEFSTVAPVTNDVSGNAARVTIYEVLDNFLQNAGKPSPAMEVSTKGIMLCLEQLGGRKATMKIGGNSQQFDTQTEFVDTFPTECTT